MLVHIIKRHVSTFSRFRVSEPHSGKTIPYQEKFGETSFLSGMSVGAIPGLSLSSLRIRQGNHFFFFCIYYSCLTLLACFLALIHVPHFRSKCHHDHHHRMHISILIHFCSLVYTQQPSPLIITMGISVTDLRRIVCVHA